MEIHQLRYFVAVADEGSFSRAAAKVRVAQPSLSQQIRKLEAEMGQPLFDRLPRSVVLTEAGRCFIDYARQILASIGDARRCVDELKGEVAGKVAVGAIPTIAPYVLPELVVTFQKHYPDVMLEIVEDVTDGITRRIEAGELDRLLVREAHRLGVEFEALVGERHARAPGEQAVAPVVPTLELPESDHAAFLTTVSLTSWLAGRARRRRSICSARSRAALRNAWSRPVRYGGGQYCA